METKLTNEEKQQKVAELALDCARRAVLEDCEVELEILAGSILHYADLYCVDTHELLQNVIRDIL